MTIVIDWQSSFKLRRNGSVIYQTDRCGLMALIEYGAVFLVLTKILLISSYPIGQSETKADRNSQFEKRTKMQPLKNKNR